MSESIAGCAAWQDVHKETFEMFTQFAYTGNYSIPRTVLIERSTHVKENEIEILDVSCEAETFENVA
jgi:hypothetical protein